MNQRANKREKDRRVSQAIFYDFPTDRRRKDYERRGRTSVRPMPVEMALRGEQRRFEENGTE